MTLKKFIKKIKRDFSFRKKVLFFGWLGILVFVGGIIAMNSDSMFASILNLSQIAQQRKANFSANKALKPQQPSLQDSCVDTDGGKTYGTKWTITTVVNWYTSIENDSCNSNGTLRERFCGQPGEVAGLLRSENYVNCQYGCHDGACITTWAIKDIVVEWGNFSASDSQHANIEIHIKNIGTVATHVDGIGHELFINSNSFSNYTFEPINPTNTLLQPNDSYVLFVNITLLGNNHFTNDTYIYTTIATYPDIDNNTSNNAYTFYLTGNFQSQEIGDIIIENMHIQTNPAVIWSNTINNKVYIDIKNIWNWDIHIPYLNWWNHFPLSCSSNGSFFSANTIDVQESILWSNESISTELIWQSYDMFWYQNLGNISTICTILSQQEQWRTTTDPNNTQLIYESNGTNNSFTLNYEVINSTWSQPIIPWDIIIENMYITPSNTPIVGTDNDTNKINLVIKNIGSWIINVPTWNAGPITTLGCSYGNWAFWWHWIVLTGTLYPNQSITTQIEANWADHWDWFNTIGNKYIECTLNDTTTTTPNSTYQIYESDDTNNSFTLFYQVISSNKSKSSSLREKLTR